MPYTSSDIAEIRKKREERQSTGSGTSGGKWQAADVARIRRESAAAREGGRARRPELDSDLYTRRTGRPAEGTEPRRTATSTRQAEEPGGLLGSLLGMMQRNTEINNSRAYRTEEIRQEADRELGQALANAITPDDPVKALGRAQRSTGLRTVPAERREEIVRESLREDGRTDEEIDAAKSRTPEALYNEYNQWLEEGDNRQRLNDLVQSEQAARKESDIDERMHRLGYTDAEIEEIRTRRREYEQSVPFGYDITHRIGSSIEGIGSEAVGGAMLIPQTVSTAVGNFFNRRELDTGDESHDELLKAVERVRNSNGMYTLDELAANNDRGWTMRDIRAAAAELDGAKESVDMDSLGGQIYRQGGRNLAEARLGLSDLQELAYSAAESAGENIALGLLSPVAALGEQTLRSAGAGIADTADAGMSAGQSLLSGLGHGAISAGIEQIGIAQMMRNMGRATGMGVVTDSILDRIAALPGMNRLTPTMAGIAANAGEEAAEEFVQSYADTALDTLLGAPDTPGLLSGELLGEAAQSALGGAAGGALIGGISTGIGAAQDVRQGRIAPRADLMANAQLSAAVDQAGQMGRAAQAAAAQTQQTQPLARQQETGQQRTAPDSGGQAAPAQRAVDPQLAELAAQSGGRLDASAWQAMQTQRSAAPGGAANAESTAAPQMSWEERAAAQGWSEEQYAEARLLAAGTDMSEAAVNVAAQAMPDGVSGDIYSMAANSMYQLARQGIAEDADEALALAGRSGVRVNQVLAAPGGEEALRMIYNRGKMDGLAASGYGAAGLADEAKAGQVQYEAGALIPEEDRALFDLYAAASDTAVTVSEKLEKNAGGYVDTALGKVYFGTQADADTFGTILHESVHQYNAWDEAGGRELQTATLRYMAEQSGFESVNDLVESYIQRYQEAGQELSYAQACEEITADAMRGVFGSEEAFGRWVEHQRALAEQNGKQRSAVARVMDKVRGMLDKVIEKAKSILAREPDNAAARQAQALAESQKRTLEELYYKHAETAMEAQRAARRSQNQTENVNESEESANENQTGVASSQQNIASSQQNVASEGENVASERRYQLPVESDEERASRRLANLNAELDDLHRQRRALREEKEAWEKSEDVQKLNAEKEAARKHGLFSAEYKAFQQTPQYQAWVENRKALNARATELEKRMGEVQDRVREVYGQLKSIRSAKNNDAQASYDEAAERNGGKAVYRRTLAVERFGTTEQFERAGYILPDGQMLDFAQNDSTRDTDHREIIDVFGPSEVRTGTEALNAFLADGNIRVMAEAPGIDVPAEVRPSTEQLERIREMAETIGAERRGFTLDFSAPDGKAVASKTYRGRINADRIVREIREYYQTGTLPEESNLAQFRYQLPVDERAMESGQQAAAWENADRAGLAEYLSELYQSGEVRRVPVERVQQLARRILTDSASKANEITVAKQLDGLMQYMTSGQADFETAFGAAEGIAEGVLQKSTRRDSSLWNEYKDLHYFTVHMERGGPEYQEMVYQYGSYALAQKELGRNGIKLTTAKDSSARGIDQLYQELSNEYPGLFPSEVTGPADQLDRIAQVRQSIRPEIKNNFGESYEEARADLAMQIIGAAVGEGVTDQGVAGMLRQRIDENLNLHRSGIQRRVVNALNEQAREARSEGFAQAQRIVRASGEANRQRLEKERAAWANTSNAMQTAMARSRNTAQRARDARSKDSTRRVIASNLSKLNRMLLHPSDQYHVPPKLLQDAIQVAELGNRATYNRETLNKLHALKDQMDEQAKASDGADSIAVDWENSGISQMLASLTTNMERRQSARLADQEDAQTRRAERGLDTMYEMQSDYMAGLEMETFSLDDLMALRDLTSAMVTVIQNSNKLLATRTAQSASEFGDLAKREVESSPSRLKDKDGKAGSVKERLLEAYNKYRAAVYNAERFFNMLGGHRHGGAMEALGKALAAGEARQTEIREKGVQQFRDVLEGEENKKLLRRFAGQDAELIDVGLSTKINRAQMVSLYMHMLNPQNRDHVMKGGVVIPNMKEYAKGHIEKAYRTNRAERITGGTIAAIEKELTTGEMADYCQKWIADLKELMNHYTKDVINETSRRLSGYDRAKVEDYWPITVDRDVLQKEIEGVVHNGTIEGRGFLKERREHSTAPVLLEEASSVMGRTLADAAAYAGLAPAIRDANKIWNANRGEQGSLRTAVRKNFGDDGVKFVEDYLTDLQQQPRARKNIFDFLSGLRGRYAGAVLTLNPGVALGQISGVPTAASELGWGPTMKAMADMLTPKGKEKMEAIRKEMTDHGYWQLEATLSNGPTAELNAVRRKPGAVQRLLEKVPGTNWLEDMDTKTRMAIWEGSKDYVDRHLEEFGLPADAHGSDAWWDAVVAKMTETNDRTQPNYTISQQAAIQRDPGQLAKTLTMFKTQGFQNYGILASAIEDYRAQGVYEQEYARQAADSSLSAEERQQAQANLEQVRAARHTAGHRLQLAVTSQVVQSMVFVVAKMAVDDWLLHRYDREKDEEGQVTPASVAQRFVGMTAENIAGNALGLSELIAVAGTLLGQDSGDPVSLTGIDAINDLSSDLLRLTQAVQADEIDPAKVWERVYDLAGSLGNVAGLPITRLQRWWEGASGWYNDIAAAANSDGLTLGDIINAPPSSASQYDRLYTDVFEEPDAEDAAKALERLADLDALDPPAKASNAKAADGKVLGELLSREREYGTRVESAAAARVAGNEGEQRRLRQELVNTLAEALGISQTDKADARRLRTVIDKVDAAIASEVKAQMGADSATGATVYTPLLTALADGGDVAGIQAGLRRAGVDDGAIKSAVVSAYKDDYLYGSEAERQRIEGQLLRLSDAYGEPYFTKTKDQDDFADWVTDWELQGLNDSVYTDLDEALATGNQAAAQEQINRYMEVGKSASSIRTRITNQYKKEYLAADSARRQEIAQFIMRLHGTKGERFITTDTLYSWVLEDAKAKAAAGM